MLFPKPEIIKWILRVNVFPKHGIPHFQHQGLIPRDSPGDQELTPSVRKGSVDRGSIWWCVPYGWLEKAVTSRQRHLHLPQFHARCSQAVEDPPTPPPLWDGHSLQVSLCPDSLWRGFVSGFMMPHLSPGTHCSFCTWIVHKLLLMSCAENTWGGHHPPSEGQEIVRKSCSAVSLSQPATYCPIPPYVLLHCP